MKIFVKIAVLSLLALSLSSCGPRKGDPQAKGKLFIYNWTYYIPEDVIDSFEKENNCEVVYDVFSANEEMFAKLTAGGSGYDIVFPGADYVDIMIRKDMIEAFDGAKIPNLKSIDQGIMSRLSSMNSKGTFAVPYFMGAAGVVVDKPVARDFDASWTIFGRKDLKGKMTLLDDPRETIGIALKTLGYSVNSVDKAELAAARDLLLSWKANILKFDSEAFGKGFQNKEYSVVHGYMENVFKELDDARRPSTAGFIPKEGGVAYMDCMTILKGAKNRDLAHKFVNYIHDPKIYASIADYLELPAVNKDARALMKTATLYSADDLARCELKLDIGDGLALWDEIWQAVRYGK